MELSPGFVTSFKWYSKIFPSKVVSKNSRKFLISLEGGFNLLYMNVGAKTPANSNPSGMASTNSDASANASTSASTVIVLNLIIGIEFAIELSGEK